MDPVRPNQLEELAPPDTLQTRSLRARVFKGIVRRLFRRVSWGAPQQVAHRARRVFGASRPHQWVRSFGVTATSGTLGGRPMVRFSTGHDQCTILYLHGGGYVSGSPAKFSPLASALARKTSALVLAPDYRLAPEHPFPAALDDASAAYAELLRVGTDPSHIFLVGDSAGGGLALSLLMRLRDQGSSMPAGAVLLSPWLDLTGSTASIQSNDGRCDLFRPLTITEFARCYAPEDQWTNPHVSPLFGSFDGLPPIHIQVAEAELLRDEAIAAWRKLREAGGSAELKVRNGVFHGWQMMDGFIPEAGKDLDDAAGFVSQHLVP